MDRNERKAFKDWWDRDAAVALADQFSAAWSGFDQTAFVTKATADIEALEMMARVGQFAEALRVNLPEPIPEALEIITGSLPEPLPDCEAVTDGWLQWSIGFFIGEYCLGHYDEAMTAMIELTQRFSAEFAVRPFAERYPERVYNDLLKLAQTHTSPHVRRWASEGIRPRLPWGCKLRELINDPSPLWPILETLKDDPELYVRRSVANNLNDIAKDHPEPVVNRCAEWAKNAHAERLWVIKHGLRTLIKEGHSGALEVIGLKAPEALVVEFSLSTSRIVVGESVELRLTLTNESRKVQKLAIDYAVEFVRQGGKVNQKVFKGKTLEIAPSATLEWSKKHPMKVTTVRALYPGNHRVFININGKRFAESAFELKAP